MPVTYAPVESVRRIALSPLRSSYIDYTTPGVQVRSSRPGEVRRIETVEAPISSYRRALSPVGESQYQRDIARLFSEIKEPRKYYAEDISKLFSRIRVTPRPLENARIGELFSRTLLSSEFDETLKYDVDSAVQRILQKTKF